MKERNEWGPADYQAIGGVVALMILATFYLLSRF
jgi:hypothetical protein